MAEEGEQIDVFARILPSFPINTRRRSDGLSLKAGVGIVVSVERASRSHAIPMLDLQIHKAIHFTLCVERAREAREEDDG